jgi:DivIVA domain-containing protein
METDIECREFTIVRKGYDPDEVRSFLRDLADAGLKPSPVFGEVGEKVAELLETAHRTAESIEAHAVEAAAELKAEAEAARAEADAHAAKIREEADAYAAEQRAEAERLRSEADDAVRAAADKAAQIVADAESIAENVAAEAEQIATARAKAAEDQVRESAANVIEASKRRLRKLLDAEREVHARLTGALAGIDGDTDQPLDRDDELLLDNAFEQFFSEDIEMDASRTWILSD